MRTAITVLPFAVAPGVVYGRVARLAVHSARRWVRGRWFMARRNFGEFVQVDERHDLVVVRTGKDFGIPDGALVLRQVTDEFTCG